MEFYKAIQIDQYAVTQLITESRTQRDLQVAVGPSEIGGCRRRVWHRLQKTEPTNTTLRLAAWMGTAIHKALEEQLAQEDPMQIRFLREIEVEHDGLKGHVDCFDQKLNTVIDWKTITKKKIRQFPSEQQVLQVQLYGWLLANNGYTVDQVMLVGIPRDGSELDIIVYSEPFDERKAIAGVEWLREIQESDVAPEPEMPRRFCSGYCQFYDPTGEKGCPSV